VILNGIEAPAREPSPPPLDPPTILCTGRLAPEKGFDVGLHALAIVREHEPRARMVIAGDGQERAALAALADRLGVADHVSFPGWVAPSEVAGHLGRSTLALVPSRAEGFGLFALEAMMAGRAVVGSRVGGLPEVVADGRTGILVPPGDPDTLARALLALLRDPRRMESMGRAGNRRAAREFTAERHIDEWDSLYRRLGTEARADVG
jgi:glycosyltransferase involved in cell wall biosynthesis